MDSFRPVNPLEIALKRFLTGVDGRYWQWLTPLASAPLWVLVQHYPELDGTNLSAPPGQNPGLCVFNTRDGKIVSVYTSEERVRAAFARFELSRTDFTWVFAPGYRVLKWLWATAHDGGETDGAWVVVNYGVDDAYWGGDQQMIELLLEKPEPPPDPATPQEMVTFQLPGDPEARLGPLRDELARLPEVLAAWVLARPEPHQYDLALVTASVDNDALLARVNLVLKAVTPVDEEWSAALLTGDDRSLRQMVAERAPFYRAAGFLAEEG